VSATRQSESPFDVVVIAASLGGVGTGGSVLSMLPPDFAASVLLVQHRRPDDGTFQALCARKAVLPVTGAVAGLPPLPGTVHVIPADRQLVLDGAGRFAELPARAQRATTTRPRADPLLASCAAAFGDRAIAVVLTGRHDDGAAGVVAVKRAGGRVIAQDRASCVAFGMPAAAIATGAVDFVLAPEKIADVLTALVMAPGAAELLRVGRSPWAQAA
jgi:two-component system, chemotaxis family, protein-glutamate methylesterase/glutaminase